MPVLTYGYNQLFSLVVDTIRNKNNMPFFEQGSEAGGPSLATVGSQLPGTTTLVSCGVDSPGKQFGLIRAIYAQLGSSAQEYENSDLYANTGPVGSQGATTSAAALAVPNQPIGTFNTINDVVNYLASKY